MMEMSEIKKTLENYREQLTFLSRGFDLEKRVEEVAQLEEVMATPEFWERQAKAQQISRQISDHKKIIEKWNVMEGKTEDLETLYELASEELSLIHI